MEQERVAHLGRMIREYRSVRNMSGRELARRSKISQSNISKFETGLLSPSKSNLKKIITALERDGNEEKRLLSWENLLISDFSPFLNHSEAQLSGNQRAILEIEKGAHVVRGYQTFVVPGLLQTERYMRAVFQGASKPGMELSVKEIDSAVKTRLKRQSVLNNVDKKYLFLLHESALRNRIAPDNIMKNQLKHLLNIKPKASCVVGLIPQGTQWSGESSNTSFDIFNEELVLVDVYAGQLYIWLPALIADYLRLFSHFQSQALYGEAFKAGIEKIMSSF